MRTRTSFFLGATLLSAIALAAPVCLGAARASQSLDLNKAQAYYAYPFAGDMPWLDDYATTMTRDGMHYIGSTGYRYIYYGGLLDWLNRFYEAKANGATLPLDPFDFHRFPKLRAAFDSVFDLTVAGGYYMPNGDTSDTPVEGRRIYAVFNRAYNPRMALLSWRFSRDPRFAWCLVNLPQEQNDLQALTPEERRDVEAAAATVKRNPFLNQIPRLLGGFGLAVLEDGTESDDYRFHRTLILHTGTSAGHHHCDALNLQIFAHGCRMTTEQGCRDDTGMNYPRVLSTYMKNVVDVQAEDWPWQWLVEHQKQEHVDTTPEEDDALWHNIGNFPGFGEAWPLTFKPIPNFMYVAGGAASANHPELKLYQRQAAMITINPGVPPKAPPSKPLYDGSTKHDPHAVTPSLYVFDVFRVAGGHTHTWCFHGCEADDFRVSVPVAKVGEDPKGPTRHNPKDCGATPAAHWLRFHPVPGNAVPAVPEKHEGTATDTFEAAWQLSRLDSPPGLTMRVSVEYPNPTDKKQEADVVWPKTGLTPMYKRNAERSQLGADYDPAAPRKVMKATVLGHGGAQVMYAMGASRFSAYGQNLIYLYLQHRGETLAMQTVWPAILEPYVGESKVKSARLLTVSGLAAGEEKDALRPVAVEVETVYGFHDVCFADGRPDRARTIAAAGIEVAGEQAYYSTDANGLRAAALINGTGLSGPAGSLRVAQRERRGRITRVDYGEQRLWVEGDLEPAALVGQEVFVESPYLGAPVPEDAMQFRAPGDGRRTSLNVVSAGRDGGATTLQAKRSLALGRMTVLDISEADGIIKVDHSIVLGTNPNRRRGIVFGNEAGTQFWRGEFVDGAWRYGAGCRYRLTGAPLSKAALTDTNEDGHVSVLVWDVGAGDVVRAQAHACLSRVEPGVYELHAGTSVRLTLPGATAEIAVAAPPDTERRWEALPVARVKGTVTFTVPLGSLVAGHALLRIR